MSADGEQGGVTQDRVLVMAKVINGPHLPVPENSRYTLDELRDVRWGLLSRQEQGMRMMEARAVLEAVDNLAVYAACQAEARGPIHETECWSTRA